MNSQKAFFIEIQRYSVFFHVFVSLFLAGCAAAVIFQLRFAIKNHTFSKGAILGTLAFIGALIFVFSINLMRTKVTGQHIRISFGELGIIRKKIPIQDIQEFETVTFNPVKDFLGYGIRRSRDGTWCYTFRGKQGVRLLLSNGKKYLIGTEKPEEFHQALSKAISGKNGSG